MDFSYSKGSEESSENLTSQTVLSWKMGQNRFTAQEGKSFNSGDYISVNITGNENNCLSDIFSFDNYISTYIPKNITSFLHINTKANVVFNYRNKPPYKRF